jgi:hypothetical protein
MTPEQMKMDRLDRDLADKVMGWHRAAWGVYVDRLSALPVSDLSAWSPTRDWRSAGMLLDSVVKAGWSIGLLCMPDRGDWHLSLASVTVGGAVTQGSAEDPDPHMAISLAVAKAYGIEVEKGSNDT